jgi:hypothetical protein
MSLLEIGVSQGELFYDKFAAFVFLIGLTANPTRPQRVLGSLQCSRFK